MVYKLRIKAKVSAYRKKSKFLRTLKTHKHTHTHNRGQHNTYTNTGLSI